MSTDSPANGGDHITTIYHPGDGNDNVLHTSVSTKICRGVRVAERQRRRVQRDGGIEIAKIRVFRD